MDRITFVTKNGTLERVGNWDGPKELFPTIDVDQRTSVVTVTYWDVSNHDRGQWGKTHEHREALSPDGQVLRITGMTGLRNDRRRTGGRQKFCFFVFRGDSGHLYTHRSVASEGWLTTPPEKLLGRLRKMGIGAEKGIVQQGDFLLKPANGHSQPVDTFAHEWMGAGHHKFSEPVLSEYVSGVGRLVYIPEGKVVDVHHEAVDGIQHPTVTVPPGQWIVGTTAQSLHHDNMRD